MFQQEEEEIKEMSEVGRMSDMCSDQFWREKVKRTGGKRKFFCF